MTDKEQIMIDSVDVSGCCYAILPKNQCPAKIKPYAKETSCIACKEHNTKLNFCKNNPNCYYKQLTRKTQECEQKDKELLSNEKIINKLMKEVDELKQECEAQENKIKKLRKNLALEIESNTRYRKALEEIESIAIKNQRENFYYDGLYELIEITIKLTSDYTLILDIINKAKGE